MRSELRVINGTQAGRVIPLTGGVIVVGRHLDATVRFDPHRDLAVSGRHAAFEHSGEAWWLRDLGSTNGTFVNGNPIHGPTLLRDRDKIEFGQGGPVAQFRIHRVNESTTGRIRAQVARQVHRMRLVVVGVVVLLIAGATLLERSRKKQQENWVNERAVMQQQIDSLIVSGQQTATSLRGRVRELDQALQESQSRVQNVSRQLQASPDRMSAGETDVLRRELQSAQASLRRQQLAASLDFNSIERRNRSAVAQLYVEAENGVVSAATAFAIRRDGVLLTTKHVLSGRDGRGKPRRLALQFSDSEQIWQASVIALSEHADLALVRVHGIIGDVPVARGLNLRADTIAAGSPVAILGFPLGGDAEAFSGKRHAMPQPLVWAGIIKAAQQQRLELEGYGAAGASGSPILDRNGEVIAVLFGGDRDPKTGATLVLGVPIGAAVDLLNQIR